MTATQTPIDQDKPAPGWACIALGVGFLLLVAGGIIAVRVLAG